ncbi:hypothetical protein KY289_028642 [Solanum tuberosum]|nr:hypothetical protein KY289_028642 [Solanum tuberosum]
MATLVPPAATTSPAGSKPTVTEPEKVDYFNLPCPIPYEEIHREALMSLKPELFEGMRFDFTRGLNQRFSLSHSVFMGPTELPTQSTDVVKIPTAHYEFGANFIDPKMMLFGRVMTDGRLTGEPHMSHGMVNFDYKGKTTEHSFNWGMVHYLEPAISRKNQFKGNTTILQNWNTALEGSCIRARVTVSRWKMGVRLRKIGRLRKSKQQGSFF